MLTGEQTLNAPYPTLLSQELLLLLQRSQRSRGSKQLCTVKFRLSQLPESGFTRKESQRGKINGCVLALCFTSGCGSWREGRTEELGLHAAGSNTDRHKKKWCPTIRWDQLVGCRLDRCWRKLSQLMGFARLMENSD